MREPKLRLSYLQCTETGNPVFSLVDHPARRILDKNRKRSCEFRGWDMTAPSPQKEGKPPPVCKAILLCEQTTAEEGTGRVSLIGLIRTLTMAAFPGRSNRMKLFLQLVDGIGEYDIRIEVHDLSQDGVIARMWGPTISFPRRPFSHQLSLQLPTLPIPHPGRYDVVVLGNGKEIDRQQFRAQLARNIEEKP